MDNYLKGLVISTWECIQHAWVYIWDSKYIDVLSWRQGLTPWTSHTHTQFTPTPRGGAGSSVEWGKELEKTQADRGRTFRIHTEMSSSHSVHCVASILVFMLVKKSIRLCLLLVLKAVWVPVSWLRWWQQPILMSMYELRFLMAGLVKLMHSWPKNWHGTCRFLI